MDWRIPFLLVLSGVLLFAGLAGLFRRCARHSSLGITDSEAKERALEAEESRVWSEFGELN